MKYTNLSNNSDSDLDDLMISSDEDQEYNNNLAIPKCSSITEKATFSSVIRKIINLNNLHMRNNTANLNDDIISGDEDENSSTTDALKIETNLHQNEKLVRICNIKIVIFLQLKCVFIRTWRFALGMLLNCLTMVKNIIFLMCLELILLANLPLKTLKGFATIFKSYTNLTRVHSVPKEIITDAVKLLILFTKTFLCRANAKVQKFHESGSDVNTNIFRGNNNFNSSETSECITGGFICLVIGLCLIPVILHCSLYSTSKISEFQSNFQYVKSKFLKYSDLIFLLPGENCMRAGNCCKGFLEGVFRWSSCVGTSPIRLILTIWHRRNGNVMAKNSGLSRIQYHLERIYEDIDQTKEHINYLDELFFHIQTSIINLELIVNEKANFLEKLSPKIEKLAKVLQNFKSQVENSIISLKKVMNLKEETYKMIDSIRKDSEESLTHVKSSLGSMRHGNEAKQQRLITQIEILENLLKEDQMKTGGKNSRFIQRIQSEISSTKYVLQEIRKRISSLFKIQTKYKQTSDSLNKEIRNKFHGEMVHHEQMSKRTEKMCLSNAEKLNNDLIKAKNNLACFINKTIFGESNNMYIKLRKEISDVLHDQTVETAQMAVDQALIKKAKNEIRISRNIKKCGILSYLFKLNEKDQTCLKDEELLVDPSVLCGPEQSKDSTIENERLLDPVDKIIDDSLNLIFADDIGKADFALESSGGSIIIESSTPPYTGRAAFLSLLGFTFGKIIKSIRKIIQPGNLPGECWAFQGDHGHVVIKLARTISVTGVTIDHASRLLTPDGKITSAPKKFSVYDLGDSEDEIKIKLGEFEYDEHGDPIQTFLLEKNSHKTNYVQFNFLSNHGNKEYTCIYRVRVHGIQINERSKQNIEISIN